LHLPPFLHGPVVESLPSNDSSPEVARPSRPTLERVRTPTVCLPISDTTMASTINHHSPVEDSQAWATNNNKKSNTKKMSASIATNYSRSYFRISPLLIWLSIVQSGRWWHQTKLFQATPARVHFFTPHFCHQLWRPEILKKTWLVQHFLHRIYSPEFLFHAWIILFGALNSNSHPLLIIDRELSSCSLSYNYTHLLKSN